MRLRVRLALAAALVLALPVVLVLGSLAARKLVYSFSIGPSFGRLDEELGWTLKPGASSYLKARSLLTGRVYYDATVFTDASGFRSAAAGTPPRPGGIVAVGDSWTFGYCVGHEESFPYFLEELARLPVTNLGVPGYGSGAAFGLLRRHAAALKPKVVVYLSTGLWERSLAPRKPSGELLIPTFYFDAGRPGLAFPEPGVVERAAKEGRYPGGSLTAGFDAWNYLRYVKGRELSERAAALFQKTSDPSLDEPWVFARSENGRKVLAYELGLYTDLAARHDFKIVWLDASGAYADAVQDLPPAQAGRIVYVPRERFERAVDGRAKELDMPENEFSVEKDGHYAKGGNRLVAELAFAAIKPILRK
jgi:hypothetical protein